MQKWIRDVSVFTSSEWNQEIHLNIFNRVKKKSLFHSERANIKSFVCDVAGVAGLAGDFVLQPEAQMSSRKSIQDNSSTNPNPDSAS